MFRAKSRQYYRSNLGNIILPPTICVKFNGIGEHTFEIYCDSRHLHWFQRFLSDQEIKKSSKNQHSSSLFTLRSGRIGWQEGKGKGVRGSAATAVPWNLHHLTLHCAVDTRLWTDEGTKLVIEEKTEDIAKNITKAKEKGELNDKQLADIKRQKSTLAKINNPFPRPSKPLYKSQSHILVGVSLGLEKPATVAVVDVISGKVLTYRSFKQLLGDNYKLLNRQRQQKQALSHARQIAQTQAAPTNEYGDSELGQYIDRLLAKEIIAIAQKYSAGSIVLPKLDGMREQINSEIQTKAEEKCPECIEAQKNYAKQYRRSVNQWSYSRLIENIESQAAKARIALEESKQPIRGSPQDKAKELVFAAYKSRKKS
ncbi:MAG: type V CRISPR-associated protein Cas12k [Cyanomargarita calcarea GSE-NOS-MK-12-04C]|jgi:transposase|uniref:Type V CRISPR-associated protein Cas12k n=1 Tax=Cyanomargarita calcarea GSE-NOS-MK-12-04C TaxID=2839659 RepID=A0A951QSB6_9CYAN|nr:type V CRISPR-associated protein Cas12k [Cyanomargarita calcarea GSE-NOS-MK-12-04C]